MSFRELIDENKSQNGNENGGGNVMVEKQCLLEN